MAFLQPHIGIVSSGMGRWVLVFNLFVLTVLAACGGTVASNAPGHKSGDATGDGSPPHPGPVDPAWMKVHTADKFVELKASRMVDEKRARDADWCLAQGETMLEGDWPDLYVHEGEICGFQYLEVILGYVEHPDIALPLVVIFHGRGGKPEIPAGFFDGNTPVRILLPQAPTPLGDGYTWLATWSLSPQRHLFEESLRSRVDELAIAIGAFTRQRQTVGKPSVFGFSQGGIISWTLAVRHPDKVSAAYPIAGWIPSNLIEPPVNDGSMLLPSIYALHGANDDVVPVSLGRTTRTRLSMLGWSLKWQEFEGVGHEVSPEMEHVVRNLLLDRI